MSFVALMLASSAAGATFTNDTDWAGADWTLANGDVVGGIHTNVGHLSIPAGATVTVQPYAAAATNMGRVTVFAASADIQGTLSANQAGFPTQTGPGAGAGRAGGGYGGHGSTGDSGLGGSPYGSVTEPVDLGSGGSFTNPNYVAGRGGGAIRIWVAGVLILDGALSANGQNGVNSWTGGGSGGSVWLTAATVSGSGSVTANGGNGTSSGGGGGGGRIAFTTGNNTFAGTYKAQGGTGARGPAGNGTFNFMDHYGIDDDLLVKAHIALPPATNWSFRNLAVSSNVTFEIQSTTAVVSRIAIAQNVLIPATAHLSANGLGHARFSGPGAGVGRSGASYGGRGSQGASAGIAPNPFGSVQAPDQLGSGGADQAYGGRGGGAVLLNVDGTVTVHGTISADGWPPVHGYGGPGSGGSVWITAGMIAGEGVVQANGGTTTYGGAGGGRIAFATATNRFTGIIGATGSGSGAYNRAGHGTFNFADHFGPTNDLVITGNIALPPATNWSFRSLTVTNGATLEIQSTPEIVTHITVANEVVVAPGAAIVADGMGFANTQGPGAPNDRGGGSHGGIGSGGSAGYGGPRYGSVTWPAELGSGGGNPGRGGHGGGAVFLDVTNALTINGTIRANGWRFESEWGGGGSGGGIRLRAASIRGSGLVQANGGNGASSGGGGGGGRIAFLTPDNRFDGLIQASGGLGHFERAGHGTFNFMDFLGADDALVIRGDIALSPSNAWTFGSLTITNNASLEIQSTNATVSRIFIARDARIASGSTLSANGMGLHAQQGLGAGARRGGGGYGGRGGNGDGGTDLGGGTYGATNAPVDLGSGGGTQTIAGNPIAGGAVILTVGGELTLDGRISANAWREAYAYSGGASGGSIWIVADRFKGTGGELLADGNRGGYGGGGGGRIAVWHGTIREHEKADILAEKTFSRLFVETEPPESFTGEAWARGAPKVNVASQPGQDGTVRFIHVVQPPEGTLFLLR